MIQAWRTLRRDLLGINRRNHEHVFRYNPAGARRLADDKLATRTTLVARGLPMPGLLAACHAHWEIERVGALLRTLPAFVLKPARGAGGAGIVVIAARVGEHFESARGRRYSWPELATHIADILSGVYATTGLADALLVEALVRCDPALARLAYAGVPDVRVLVFRGLPVLAMLRLPTRRSNGRANLHVGGIGVGIDLSTGISTTAVQMGRRVSHHPDLDVPLAGLTVSGWQRILELAADASAAVGLGYAGVDLVIDADHGPLLLELNARPGLEIQSANECGLRPLLAAAAQLDVPDDLAARVALGQRVAATSRTGRSMPR